MKDLDKIQERGSLRLSTRQAGAVTFGVLLLVSLSFVVGIQVGRILSPSEADLAAPDVAAADRSIAEILSAYESRALARGAVEDAEPPHANGPAHAGDGEATAADPQTDGDDPPSPTPSDAFQLVWGEESTPPEPDVADGEGPEPVAEGDGPETTADPDTAEETTDGGPEGDGGEASATGGLPRPGDSGVFAVQLAAFSTKQEANALLQALRAARIDAYSMEAVVRGQTWYRVRVGRFDSRSDADAWVPALAPYTQFEPVVMGD